MKTSSMKDKKLIGISLVLIILIWVVISNIIDNSIYLPKLSEVIKEISNIIREKGFTQNIIYSLIRASISFLMNILYFE